MQACSVPKARPGRGRVGGTRRGRLEVRRDLARVTSGGHVLVRARTRVRLRVRVWQDRSS